MELKPSIVVCPETGNPVKKSHNDVVTVGEVLLMAQTETKTDGGVDGVQASTAQLTQPIVVAGLREQYTVQLSTSVGKNSACPYVSTTQQITLVALALTSGRIDGKNFESKDFRCAPILCQLLVRIDHSQKGSMFGCDVDFIRLDYAILCELCCRQKNDYGYLTAFVLYPVSSKEQNLSPDSIRRCQVRDSILEG
ncbi:hypothetical protein KIN20_002850 [Parelaphostrongylus tenuis]|uniref:Uncharacterized protein n=1 Tax=Parelaphostrongylus tenuis TaxID=148309 RepID=A0AAD5M0F0_PARTN|nr:hypothetical protein KIN20_002850 [Parelaphostrongylus tenuis]